MSFRTAIGWTRDVAILVGCAALVLGAIWFVELFTYVCFG